jgi:hypothetical protein
VIVGRRGGKSRVAALVAVYLACFRSYAGILAPGEKGTVMLLAADRRQARVLMRYVVGTLDAVPMLRALVVNRTAESVELSNRIVVEIHTASFRAVRGYTVVAAICDELAYWRSEDSANPDVEILTALRPAMATVPGALLLCISSPYARRGALWQAYSEHFGQDGDVLVWQASSASMNPTLPARIVEDAYAADAASAAAEYGAQFRRDIESFIDAEILAPLTPVGLRERGPLAAIQYVAFVDPAGGSGGDSMTLAVAHRERESAILDLVAEVKPPFSPDTVTDTFAHLLNAYSIRTVTGDRYAGDWPREAFRRRGIRDLVDWRDPKDVTKRVSLVKSDIYKETLPMLNAGRVSLLDHDRLRRQLVSLERRTGSTGRDSIDHPPGAHDDLANAACGALLLALRGASVRPMGGTPSARVSVGIVPAARRLGELGTGDARAGASPRGPRPSPARVGGQAAKLAAVTRWRW